MDSNGFRPNDLGQTACYAIPELSITLDVGTGLYRVAQTHLHQPYLRHSVLIGRLP